MVEWQGDGGNVVHWAGQTFNIYDLTLDTQPRSLESKSSEWEKGSGRRGQVGVPWKDDIRQRTLRPATDSS